MTSTYRLTDEHLPSPFKAADSASLRGQSLYMRATRLRLSFAVLAAALAAMTLQVGDTWDLAALCVALAFIATLSIEVWLLVSKPERSWYDGRAFAESIKTLSWRYTVTAAPFSSRLPEHEVDRLFISEVGKVISEAPSDTIAVTSPVHITERMREIRRSPLSARRDAYLKWRIEDQLQWYAGKADINNSLAGRWRVVLIAIEGAGIVAAILKAGGTISFDLPGIVAALLGAGSAWFAVRQYEALGRAYTFAANDLSIVHARLQSVDSEGDWEREAADAEEAISREHTMWRASRGAA
ncbi:integral membrane protein [Streptomyces viridosporus ATCC 14672]|uniref:Integral membrane protein n=1 Tax=Streptomyces viridosporus (strain ATCC 14672 / DSM 40746 / JCM 4963 / KCTC 9882 / NRRL B-12104 / FH 1290) TaxID=566461 RepID=D6A9E3_STRV1|nr:DUF4231 domain-containing protein [Streptomyces viridosporus]EFE68179.1 integral membrane protein [Streptomyces viridosporus ATCC 14672]